MSATICPNPKLKYNMKSQLRSTHFLNKMDVRDCVICGDQNSVVYAMVNDIAKDNVYIDLELVGSDSKLLLFEHLLVNVI